MKKFLLSMMVFFSVLSFNGCTDPRSNQDNSTEESSKIGLQDFGSTIPVGIQEENGKWKVSFIITPQFYELKATKKNEKYISMIRRAIKEESPIHVFIKPNSNEIAKVEKATEENIRYFKSAFTNEVKSESNKLVSVIPNLNTLNQLFAQIKKQTCGTSTASFPCIPFKYAVDGCYARAHKIRQILANNGYDCEKQFVYGNLKASTGTCCVSWSYHVAILVSYKNSSGTIEKRIIDPSLFPNRPVTDVEWRKACTNSSCGRVSISSYTNTQGNVYYRSPSGSLLYDNNYNNTNCVLTTFSPLSGCSPSPAPSVKHCSY